MKLAIFDLDNTLIAGDSDHAWGEFLVGRGLVDKVSYQATNDQFYADYCAGCLDIIAYSEFVFGFLAQHELNTLQALHHEFMTEVIRPMMLSKAQTLIEQHRRVGDRLLIITATNRFITEHIAQAFGIPELLATDPEYINGKYTGKVLGVPCYKEGKITRFQAWLAQQTDQFDDIYFYSDSHNDLPLLKQVNQPVVVNPDAILADYAIKAGWPMMDLRD